jgi:hypothetical protein
MRVALGGLLAAGTLLMAAAPSADAHVVIPKSAVAFRDSVGVATHVGYTDTAYARWPLLVSRLDELGVRHVRDGAYGDASPAARAYNDYVYRSIDLAAAHGIRFTFLMGGARGETGTLDELVRVVAGRLRHATEALEAPNEFDKYVGGRRWASRLTAYSRSLYRKVHSESSLHGVPVLAPSLANPGSERRLGGLRRWFDLGNVHPYTGGRSPDPGHVRTELADAHLVSGPKPVWATEAGFHNALRNRVPGAQPPVSEHAGAVYLLRTYLEHFSDGIDRTYAYELIDEKPDPQGRDPEQHFGLLRNDYSRKPAFNALENLITLAGRGGGRPRLRPLRLGVSGGAGVRRLLLRKADGSYLLALWRTASIWDAAKRRPLRLGARPVTVQLPRGGRAAVADPVASTRLRRLRARHGRVRLSLAASPLVLRIDAR